MQLLTQPEIDCCVRMTQKFSPEFALCSVGDLFFVLEAVRKDSRTGRIQASLRQGDSLFHDLCRNGRIMLLSLSTAALLDGSFSDPYSDDLKLDLSVFGLDAPVDSVRALNVKELNSWGWDLS